MFLQVACFSESSTVFLLVNKAMKKPSPSSTGSVRSKCCAAIKRNKPIKIYWAVPCFTKMLSDFRFLVNKLALIQSGTYSLQKLGDHGAATGGRESRVENHRRKQEEEQN